jgi:type IV pilus assembly protein PilQ
MHELKMKNRMTTHQIKSLLRFGVLSSLLWLVAPALAEPLLSEIRYSPLQSGDTEIAFVFDEKINEMPQLQVQSNPARIQVQFNQAKFAEPLASVEIDKAGIDKASTEQVGDGFITAVHLEQLQVYSGRVEDNVFYLHIADSSKSRIGHHRSNQPELYINKVQSIDFRRGEKGEGRLLVFLKENTSAVNVAEKDGKVVVEFYNTDIPDELLYQLDVMDFGTVVKGVETFKDGAVTRMVIEPLAAFSFQYQQLDNVFRLDLQKDLSSAGFMNNAKEYKGRAISLNFQDIPVRTVLQIIADYNSFNLVTSDSVTGNVTLRLDGTPWDQALDIVLKVRGLDKRMDGNILMVAPTEELADREAKELEARNKVAELEPLFSEFIAINYAKAADLAKLLSNKESSLLSARGVVSVDERTNTMLLKDTASAIENVRRLIERLDVPVKQVLIESRMVTVKDSVADELGIRWGFNDQQLTKGVGGSLEAANELANGRIPSLAGNSRYNVNLPLTNSAGRIGFHIAKLGDGTLIDLELSALEEENKAEIVASPRISTANQKKARIEQGVEIPYVSAASSGATTVEFKKAVLSLEVTPQVTPDNKIILDLIVTQDTEGKVVQTSTGNAVAIDTQRIQTQVLVENGETLVLGGIYQQQTINTVQKVPFLGDIPYVGVMFRRSLDKTEKKELLIFVTPKILNENK